MRLKRLAAAFAAATLILSVTPPTAPAQPLRPGGDVVRGNGSAALTIMVHVQNKGWMGPFTGGQIAGTVGQSLRMEAITISALGRHICYSAHVQGISWQPEVCDGAVAGTTGRSLRLEALRIRVDRGHVVYYSDVQGIGWQGPFQDGATAGTVGRSLRMEAVSVQLADAVSVASGSTSASQSGVYWLGRRGNSHGWAIAPSPSPTGDGSNYADWSVTLTVPPNPSGVMTLSPRLDAPSIYPAVYLWKPVGGVPWTQPIKYMTVDAAAWLSKIEFSDGYTYTFPSRVSLSTSFRSIDLVQLGLVSHLSRSTSMTLAGRLQVHLGRAYLNNDWQKAKGWADQAWCRAYGTATLTTTATLQAR